MEQVLEQSERLDGTIMQTVRRADGSEVVREAPTDRRHTPGPWRWSDAYTNGAGEDNWSLLGADGYGILCCDGVPNSPQGLGDKANARLIEAAPELLDALSTAYARLPDDQASDLGFVEELLARLDRPFKALPA